MELIQKYMKKHHNHMVQVFTQIGKQSRIQATKVFDFMKNCFDKQSFIFEINGRDFFSNDQNSSAMQKLLQSYYRMTQNDNNKKFYLYRIQFSFQEITDIIDFWLKMQPALKIVYIQDAKSQVTGGILKINQNQQESMIEKPLNMKNDSNLQQNNQFDTDDEELPQLLSNLEIKLQQLNEIFKNSQKEQQRNSVKKQIQDVSFKIKVYQQRLKASSIEMYERLKKKEIKNIPNGISHQPTDSPKINNKKINVNYKAIYDFYAKQTHLTGVKATFERIQHESQTINYQKLVHFLRQFNLLPSSVEDRKKVHALYIKYCQSSRVLNLQGFMNVLDGVISTLSKEKSKQERGELLKQKIIEKNTKNGKILNHPFHSLEKQDFRININQLTYNFKLKPHDGKFIHEINESLQKRRKDKQDAKNERQKKKQHTNLRYLRKLQSVDPFSPLLIKNSKLFEPKPKNLQSIASLQNIQRFRDSQFNFENHFGINIQEDAQRTGRQERQARSGRQKVKRNLSMNEPNNNGQGYKKGQETLKKVEKLERDQFLKMESLMSGIIERSNAKIKKLGIAQTKRQKSLRLS